MVKFADMQESELNPDTHVLVPVCGRYGCEVLGQTAAGDVPPMSSVAGLLECEHNEAVKRLEHDLNKSLAAMGYESVRCLAVPADRCLRLANGFAYSVESEGNQSGRDVKVYLRGKVEVTKAQAKVLLSGGGK